MQAQPIERTRTWPPISIALILLNSMALGTCSICHKAQAKYKCPKCSIEYCSLPCFKDPAHDHEGIATTKDHGPSSLAPAPVPLPLTPTLYESVAADPVIKSLLGYKSLQVHLAVVLRLLSDSRITSEPLAENRREIANLRLCELRTNGAHENVLVEEFVQRVLFLMSNPPESHREATNHSTSLQTV